MTRYNTKSTKSNKNKSNITTGISKTTNSNSLPKAGILVVLVYLLAE
jgi:hypothetical protein